MSRRLDALRALAERPGTPEEGEVARRMLKRLEQRQYHSPAVSLIIEIKGAKGVLSGDENQLVEYMQTVGCSLGLLISPTTTWAFHPGSTPGCENAIERFVEVPTADLLGLPSIPGSDASLESVVRGWLGRLAAGEWPERPEPGPVRSLLIEHIIPAVATGRILSNVRL